MWRSPVAYSHGVRVVAGSNPVIPTTFFKLLSKGLSSSNPFYLTHLRSNISL